MTPEQIDALIGHAGLRGIVRVYPFAIEITGTTGYEVEPNSYEALSVLLTFYGDERASEMRERAAQEAESLIGARRREIAEAIRALPTDPPIPPAR